MKNAKGINFWIYIIMLLPFLYVAYVWNSVPDTIPVHFNEKGEADGYGSKNMLIWMPILLIGSSFFIYKLVPIIDPKKRFEQMGNSFDKIMFFMISMMSAISIFFIYSSVSGGTTNNNLLTAILGLFFMALGNYLPTVKPNYFIGIRTPWTLEYENIWRKTHRLAGHFFMAGGLFITISSLFLAPENAIYLMLGTSMLITIIPAIFSYLEYKKMELG